jgi:hypothetical protein
MAVAPNQHENIHFSIERGMRTMNWVQVFVVRKRIILEVKRVSLLVIGCHTYYSQVAGFISLF